jgi:hypothetical protein
MIDAWRVTRCRTSSRATCATSRRRSRRHAKGYGLDFFPTLFEVVSYDQMNELASYGGFPVRYPHWRFGMEYEQLSKSYEYGLSKIYEMVINNNPIRRLPARGQLARRSEARDGARVRARRLLQEQLLLPRDRSGQGDAESGEPLRKWIDSMANHGTTIRRWADRIGIEKIEEFVDDCLSLENLIDPNKPFLPQKPKDDQEGDRLPRLRRGGRGHRPHQGRPRVHGGLPQPEGVRRRAEEEGRGGEGQAPRASPRAPTATCSASSSITRRSSAGRETCSGPSAPRPTTSGLRCRRRS